MILWIQDVSQFGGIDKRFGFLEKREMSLLVALHEFVLEVCRAPGETTD